MGVDQTKSITRATKAREVTQGILKDLGCSAEELSSLTLKKALRLRHQFNDSQYANTNFLHAATTSFGRLLKVPSDARSSPLRFNMGPTKTLASRWRKEFNAADPDYKTRDGCRGQFFVHGAKEAKKVADYLEDLFEKAKNNGGIYDVSDKMRINLNAGGKFKNHFAKPKAWGFQALIANFEVKTNHGWTSAELQVLDYSMIDVAKKTHVLYSEIKNETEEYMDFCEKPQAYMDDYQRYKNDNGIITIEAYLNDIRPRLYPEIAEYEAHRQDRQAIGKKPLSFVKYLDTLYPFTESALSGVQCDKPKAQEQLKKIIENSKTSPLRSDINQKVVQNLETMLDLWKSAGLSAGYDEMWARPFPTLEKSKAPKREDDVEDIPAAHVAEVAPSVLPVAEVLEPEMV